MLEKIYQQLLEQIPQPATAQELMSSPVRTVLPDTTVEQAHRVLLRYGHSGLSVVDRQGQLVGIISRRDLDIALHHGFDHAPVKGYMKSPVRTIGTTTTLPQIQALMVTYDIGRLPVINAQGHLQGIVPRTDVLRQLYHHQPDSQRTTAPHRQFLFQPLQDLLPPPYATFWNRPRSPVVNGAGNFTWWGERCGTYSCSCISVNQWMIWQWMIWGNATAASPVNSISWWMAFSKEYRRGPGCS